MNVLRVVGVCAAAAALTFAGTAEASGPKKRASKSWQRGPALQRVHPIRMASFTRINGQIVLTSPWIERGGAGSPDTTVEPAFDCYEGNPQSLPGFNEPTGFNSCGANATNFPGNLDGTRWFGGFNWVQPRTFNDMTVAGGFSGALATRISFAWFQPSTPTNYFVAISTYETFGTNCQFPADPGEIDGVIMEFLPAPPPIPPATGSGYFADEDLSTGTTPLSLGLPADGSGAYSIEFYSDAAATTLVTLPGAQPFYWGTGEDEQTPDGRAGTQDINEFDDDTAPFGGAYSAAECYNLTAAPNQCPSVLGPMMEFWAKGGTCYPDCNADGVLTVADFGCFQTKFVLGDPYADCNGDSNLTVPDFGCFQTKFVVGCP